MEDRSESFLENPSVQTRTAIHPSISFAQLSLRAAILRSQKDWMTSQQATELRGLDALMEKLRKESVTAQNGMSSHSAVVPPVTTRESDLSAGQKEGA
jgi:hypothetical protein